MQLIEHYLTNNPCYQANVKRADSRYTRFQTEGPKGLMLHSVGCAQPKAEVFCRRWDRADFDKGCVHALIDAKTGAVWQTLPWNYRGWHCGGSGNNTHVGVELCESDAIRYEGGAKFTVLDRDKALADCKRSYEAAVELFAQLCRQYRLDPGTAVCSHKEGGKAGIASGHVDPEHYWSGLGTAYTMAGFRADVAAALEELPAPETPPQPEEGALPFSDVAPGDWYADALRWALEKQIVLPASGPFHPEAPLTKAAAVVLLRRFYRRLMAK